MADPIDKTEDLATEAERGTSERTPWLVLLLALVTLLATAPAQAAPSTELQYLGQQIFPTSTVFHGTTFGGLSSITYDAHRGVFYAISDDQVNSRFYTLRIGVGPHGPSVEIVGVTTLRDASGP